MFLSDIQHRLNDQADQEMEFNEAQVACSLKFDRSSVRG